MNNVERKRARSFTCSNEEWGRILDKAREQSCSASVVIRQALMASGIIQPKKKGKK